MFCFVFACGATIKRQQQSQFYIANNSSCSVLLPPEMLKGFLNGKRVKRVCDMCDMWHVTGRNVQDVCTVCCIAIGGNCV